MNKADIEAWRRSLKRQAPEPRRVVAPAPAITVESAHLVKVRAEVTGPGEITMRLGELTIVAQRGWIGQRQRVWVMDDGRRTLGDVLALFWPERDRRNTAWLQDQLDKQYDNHQRRTR